MEDVPGNTLEKPSVSVGDREQAVTSPPMRVFGDIVGFIVKDVVAGVERHGLRAAV